MTPVAKAVAALSVDIAELSKQVGTMVVIDGRQVVDRGDALPLKPKGLWSASRTCRLVRAADGWVAVNLARAADMEAASALIGGEIVGDPWRAIVRWAETASSSRLLAQARLLGMPVARVGEAHAARLAAPVRRMAAGSPTRRTELKVIDLSSLWAGPLCGDVLAKAGALVTKVESRRRPDSVRLTSPGFFARLNGRKTHAALDFSDGADVKGLFDTIATADVVITNARPRAFDQLGLNPEGLFAVNPGLTWVAITGYGWFGRAAERVAFGDDAAAAGGLVAWSSRGAPRFTGDAEADPLTGLAAALAALKALRRGGGALVDAALARSAAGAVAEHRSGEEHARCPAM